MPVEPPAFKPSRKQAAGVWALIGLPSRGQSLHSAVTNGFEFHVYARLAIVMDLSLISLAKRLGVSETTIRRRRKSGRLNPIESDKVFRAAKIFAAAVILFEGNRAAANAWLRSPVLGLNEKTPLEMLNTNVESDAVMDLIGRLEHGVFV
jgi:putative toxin-antitoxin system antitoxin component (TIGR02293 family)